MKRVIHFIVLLAFVGFSSFLSPLEAAEPIRWTCVSAYPPGGVEYDVCLPTLIEAIEKETKGQIKIKLVAPGILCPVRETLDGLAAGMFQMALSSSWGKVPETNMAVFVMYAMYEYTDLPILYYNYGLMDFLRNATMKKDLHYLTPNPEGPYAFFTNFPVSSLKDLKDKKIRTSQSAVPQAIVRELGGASVYLPGGELYMALKLGTVDGLLYTVAELETMKLKEVLKYAVIEPPIAASTLTQTYVNLKSWNSLSADLKKAVDKACRDSLFDQRNKCYALDQVAIKASKEYGVKFINLPKEEMDTFNAAKFRAIEVVLKTYPECVPGYEIIKQWLKKEKGVSR